eukprot:2740175-Pleurochrysis_carterae.AAC.1
MAQLLFNAAYVIDGGVDAIDGEMAEACVDKVFKTPNLPPRTLDHVIVAGGHRADNLVAPALSRYRSRRR